MTIVDKELRRFMNGIDESVVILSGVPLCMYLQHAQRYIEKLRTAKKPSKPRLDPQGVDADWQDTGEP